MNGLRATLFATVAVLLLAAPSTAKNPGEPTHGARISGKNVASVYSRRSVRLAQLPENSLPTNVLPQSEPVEPAHEANTQPVPETETPQSSRVGDRGYAESQWGPYSYHSLEYNRWEGYCEEVMQRQLCGGSPLSFGCRGCRDCASKFSLNIGCRESRKSNASSGKHSTSGCIHASRDRPQPLDILAFVNHNTCCNCRTQDRQLSSERNVVSNVERVEDTTEATRSSLPAAPLPPPLLMLPKVQLAAYAPAERAASATAAATDSRDRSKVVARESKEESCSCGKARTKNDGNVASIMLSILRGESIR